MSDEQAIEAIRTILNRMDDPAWTVPQVQTFLAALRAAGYEIYRPGECDRYWMVPGNNRIERHRGHLWADQGPERDGELSPAMRDGQWVRLVPVGGEG